MKVKVLYNKGQPRNMP